MYENHDALDFRCTGAGASVGTSTSVLFQFGIGTLWDNRTPRADKLFTSLTELKRVLVERLIKEQRRSLILQAGRQFGRQRQCWQQLCQAHTCTPVNEVKCRIKGQMSTKVQVKQPILISRFNESMHGRHSPVRNASWSRPSSDLRKEVARHF